MFKYLVHSIILSVNPRHSKSRRLFIGPVFVRNFPKAASKFNDGIVYEGKFYVRKISYDGLGFNCTLIHRN